MNLTKGALRKMVQEEMLRQQKLREENTVAGNPGMSYNSPRFVKKRNSKYEHA